jgi:diaminopimelate epimerase
MQNTLQFYKYQGTGNDFVIIDNRDLEFPKDKNLIGRLCDRRFGIGGDGLILLENDEEADFKMVYYNADGNESTMCGNGGRCLVAFAHFMDIFEEKTTFMAVDGLHEAGINSGIVKLKMIDVQEIRYDGENAVLNTGSPHFVQFVDSVQEFPVYSKGKEIRNSPTYRDEGINVNFAEKRSDHEIFVRTYERGVEDETFSCGTGVTASALVFMKEKGLKTVDVKVLGGALKVYADHNGASFTNVWLEGPAVQVFKGKIAV